MSANLAELRPGSPAPRPRRKPLGDVAGTPSTRAHYRIENPGNLAAVGAAFLEEFNRGAKHFVVASTNYKSAQQRAVLAVASYFDQLFHLRTLIVSDSLTKGPIAELVAAGEALPRASGRPALARFFHHFDFACLAELARSDVRDDVFEDYDLVLWDPPCLNLAAEVSRSMRRFAALVDSVTVIVANSAAGRRDEAELRRHFDGFGINVAGIRFRELLKGDE
jgi:hypothetical protein